MRTNKEQYRYTEDMQNARHVPSIGDDQCTLCSTVPGTPDTVDAWYGTACTSDPPHDRGCWCICVCDIARMCARSPCTNKRRMTCMVWMWKDDQYVQCVVARLRTWYFGWMVGGRRRIFVSARPSAFLHLVCTCENESRVLTARACV